MDNDTRDVNQEQGDEKADTVSAAGFEMMELLIFSAQMLKENAYKMVPDVEVQ